eukprot:COSAG05_NODE_88_length_20344_cov_12.094690_8_plen_823_part_00
MAFWKRASFKLCSEACRSRGIWPGGDAIHLRDRLVRWEFLGPDALAPNETLRIVNAGGVAAAGMPQPKPPPPLLPNARLAVMLPEEGGQADDGQSSTAVVAWVQAALSSAAKGAAAIQCDVWDTVGGEWLPGTIIAVEPHQPPQPAGVVLDAQETAATSVVGGARSGDEGGGGPKVLCHYEGWDAQWDEWVALTSGRLAKRGHTKSAAAAIGSVEAVAKAAGQTLPLSVRELARRKVRQLYLQGAKWAAPAEDAQSPLVTVAPMSPSSAPAAVGVGTAAALDRGAEGAEQAGSQTTLVRPKWSPSLPQPLSPQQHDGHWQPGVANVAIASVEQAPLSVLAQKQQHTLEQQAQPPPPLLSAEAKSAAEKGAAAMEVDLDDVDKMAAADWDRCRRGISLHDVVPLLASEGNGQDSHRPYGGGDSGGGSVEAQVACVLGAMVRALVADADASTNARAAAAREARRLRNKGPKVLSMRRRGMIAYPKVQVYVLMGTAGSYTDFHIDFGGTSVWYHIVQGEKIFYVLPPTKPNLRRFEEWGTSPAQSATFFPDIAPGPCMRVHLKAGDTFLIPPGWIHGVFTPVDSVVFGGNFLHGLDMGMQLEIYALEKRMGVAQRQQFPFFEEMNWRAAHVYVLRWRIQRAAMARAQARASAAASLSVVSGRGGGAGGEPAVAAAPAKKKQKKGHKKAAAAAAAAAVLSTDPATRCDSWLSDYEIEGLVSLSTALQEWLDREGSAGGPRQAAIPECVLNDQPGGGPSVGMEEQDEGISVAALQGAERVAHELRELVAVALQQQQQTGHREGQSASAGVAGGQKGSKSRSKRRRVR